MKIDVEINHTFERIYPFVGRSGTGVVVYFIKPNVGLCFSDCDTDNGDTVGDFQEDWNEEIFKPLPKGSKIIIEV